MMAIQKLLVINDVVVSRFASSNCYYNYPNPTVERMRGWRGTTRKLVRAVWF